FHPREDVRRGVIPRLPSGLAGLATYLRTDPTCASRVAELPLRSGLRLALDLHARDLATDAELCRALAGCDEDELVELLRYGPRRSKDQLGQARRWLDGEGRAPDGIDLLDRLVAAIDFTDAHDGDASHAIPPLVRTSRHADCGARMVVSVVTRLLQRGRIADPLLTL